MKVDLTFLRGQTVTCAVSGGADSVALLHMLRSVRQELDLTLQAAHFNHGLRPSADRDEQFVCRLCRQWDVPLVKGSGNVRAMALQEGMSLEEAARTMRYGFLAEQPGLIAVAHHADDQVETVLLNLLRGTGLKGLGGMRRQQGRIVRPLLCVTRAEILEYLTRHGLSWCEDETNATDDAMRNRIRHHVVPQLTAENPNLAETVGRMTALLQRDEALLQAQTEALLEEAARGDGYDCRVLRASPLCQRAVRQLLRLQRPAMAHVQAVCRLMEDTAGTKKIDLPHMTVRREYEVLYFGVEEATGALQQICVSAREAGSAIWGRWKISWQAGHGELTIRERKSADTIRLPGGTKTVKKLLIDRKIPVYKRAALPVVIHDGTVVAVGNVANTAKWLTIEEREYEDQ